MLDGLRKKKDTSEKIRNESGNIITNATQIKRIIRKYYEQLHANNLDNLTEWIPINRPILNHKETEILNIPIPSKQTESVIENVPTMKSPGLHGFTGKVYPIFKELISIFKCSK